MTAEYRNKLDYMSENTGGTRRKELASEPFLNSANFPETVTLEDIDTEFKKWVEEKISLDYEGKTLPTVALFATQRFSEYMQSWKDVDSKKNLMMNFKVITRDTNPKPGTLYGQTRNVPGERRYSYRKELSVDKNGRKVILDYKVKQPYCVDVVYKISVVTNKMRLLNKANEALNNMFKSITTYLNVKGHYMPMNLGDIGDDSEYQINDRQFYSQTYSITVKGYLIDENDYELEEKPLPRMSCIEGDINPSFAEIEEIEDDKDVEYEYKDIKMTVQIDRCATRHSFTSDSAMIFNRIEVENINSFEVRVNNEKMMSYSLFSGNDNIDLRINDGDYVEMCKVVKENEMAGPGIIRFYGYEPFTIEEKKDINI